MLSAGIAMPVMGGINDHYTLAELTRTAPELAAQAQREGIAILAKLEDGAQKQAAAAARVFGASMTFRWVTVLPVALLLLYGGIFLYDRTRGGYRAVKLRTSA
jgi:ABC-type sulfate transport system permease subunit